MKQMNRGTFLKRTAVSVVMLALGGRLLAQIQVHGEEKPVASAPLNETWPKLRARLHAEADKRVVTLSAGSRVVLDATHGALAPDIGDSAVRSPGDKAVAIPADGFLTFAVEVAETLYATGSAVIVPDGDLRPGMRVYVLSDDTLLATPMVAAPSWVGVGNPLTGPAPDCQGAKPSGEVRLVKWLLAKGRHYITVAGPHFRSGGTFERLEIIPLDGKVEQPVYQFALTADSHVGVQKPFEDLNLIMCNLANTAELAATFKRLREQGVAFALSAGDMTTSATRDQFAALAGAFKESGLPGYGCVGNHDSYHTNSRPDMLELLPGLFPGGTTDYILYRRPLRFIVLDASFWKHRDGKFHNFYDKKQVVGIGMKPEQMEWLQWALSSDTTTPTVVVSHYVFFNRGGLSSCGYNLGSKGIRESNSDILDLLEKAPNVIATLNGHTHWNEVTPYRGISCIQNAAFGEWPCTYRVFRVYPDRVEWEVRQIGNRGLLRESFLPPKALSWMISTHEGDLAGEVRLRAQNK